MVIDKKGMMFVLSSPSGVGKTTLTKKLAENNSQFVISVSYTTRKPRANEINGKDYHFVTPKEFTDLVKKEKFFEHANIFDNFYGTHKETVINLLSQGIAIAPQSEEMRLMSARIYFEQGAGDGRPGTST